MPLPPIPIAPVLADNEVEIVVGVVFALIWIVGQLAAVLSKKGSKAEEARRRAEIRDKIRRGPSSRGDLPPTLDPDRSPRQSDGQGGGGTGGGRSAGGQFDADPADDIEGRSAGLDAAREAARRREAIAKRERDDATRHAETRRRAAAKREAAELAQVARQRAEQARRDQQRRAARPSTQAAPARAKASKGDAPEIGALPAARSATDAKMAPIADVLSGAGHSGSTDARRQSTRGLAALLRGTPLRRQIVINELLRPPVGLRPPEDRGV